MPADRNLLFGILALQMGFIRRDALLAAMNGRVLNKKKKPLGRILVDRGALQEDARSLLEDVVQQHVEMHEGDPRKSLASLRDQGHVLQDLEQITDPDMQRSRAAVLATHQQVSDEYSLAVWKPCLLVGGYSWRRL
jgi:polyhydroxyalkanoate synthesis regulator phasin